MKKGFTLIELLAVIVILAIIALILTPVVQDIIASAKDSANKRSVEGHVKNVEYAIVGEAFNNGKESNYYDCVSGTDTVDTLTIPDSDKITCESYTIVAGMVEKALQCTDNVKNWGKKYDYIKGKGVIVASDNTNMFEYVDLSSSSSSSYGNNSNTSISLNPGNYLIYLSYADAKLDTTGGISRDSSNDELNLSYGNASCSVLDKKGYSVSGEGDLSGVYATLTNNTKVYKCTISETTTISYNGSNNMNNYNPVGVNISAVKVTGNENFTAITNSGSGGNGNGSGGTPIAGPTETAANGRTIYTGRLLSSVKTVFFNVSTGQKCSISEWSTNVGNNGNGKKIGCLKFYAYMEDDLAYTMILDRNTDDSYVAWASSGNNASGPVTAAAKLKSDTDSWVNTITPSNYTNVFVTNGSEVAYEIKYDDNNYKARFITTDEIMRITSNTNFSSVTTGSTGWFYLDGYALKDTDSTWHTQIATSSRKSVFAWLFDYTNDCIGYGCNSTNPSVRNYWTSDAIAGTTDFAWLVNCNGAVTGNYGTDHGLRVNYDGWRGMGIRPVITVLKTLVD